MPVEQIPDHVDRSAALLPAQHARELWRAFLRAVIGTRGPWADDAVLWAVRDTTRGNLVIPNASMFAFFGEDEDVITSGDYVEFTLPESKVVRVSLATPPAIVKTAEEVDAALLAREVLPFTHDQLDEQVAAEVEASLAGAGHGLQEVEGELHKLRRLRTLELAAGAQLDGVGDQLGEPRNGLGDADYRDVLRLKATLAAHRATIPAIVDAASALSGVDFAQLQEGARAFFQLYLHGSESTAAARAILRQLRALGVGNAVVSAGGVNPLVFGPDGGWHRIVSVGGNVFEVEGDVTPFFAAGEEVRVFDYATQSVVHSTAVMSVTFVGPNTDVGVADDGGIAPDDRVLENISRGLQDGDGGPLGEAYPIVGFTGPASFRVAGDATTEFTGGGPGSGHGIRVLGSSGDDRVYRVLTVSFAAGETSVEVTPTPAAGAGDGQLYHVSPTVAEAEDPALDVADNLLGELADDFAS